ncbi:MAG: hypothetical protein ACKO5A_08275 [Actinomycetota bacterium]
MEQTDSPSDPPHTDRSATGPAPADRSEDVPAQKPFRFALDLDTGESWNADLATRESQYLDATPGGCDAGAEPTNSSATGPPSTSGSSSRSSCGSYIAGHDPHVIQIRLCCQETKPEDVARLVEILSIDDSGWIRFRLDGEVHRRWNHQSERLRQILAVNPDAAVEASLRWRLLKVYRPDLSSAWVFTLGRRRTRCQHEAD